MYYICIIKATNENLEEYSELKCLWLECNAISQISGLCNQTELRCLYLHNNFIRKIENLENCPKLDTLSLSHNYIKRIENCSSLILPQLNTLSLSHNSLSSIDGLEELKQCKNLSVLDVSHNRIEDVLIVKILSQMRELRVLTLTGNPVVSKIPSYRKTLTIECKCLTYLDSRPIFDKDRACAEAWKRGGYEEERQELMRWNAAQQKKVMDSVRATLRMRSFKESSAKSEMKHDDKLHLESSESLQQSTIAISSEAPGRNCPTHDLDEQNRKKLEHPEEMEMSLNRNSEPIDSSEDFDQGSREKQRLHVESIDFTIPKLIDVNSKNILNICMDMVDLAASKLENDSFDGNETQKPTSDNSKSLIEMLPDSEPVVSSRVDALTKSILILDETHDDTSDGMFSLVAGKDKSSVSENGDQKNLRNVKFIDIDTNTQSPPKLKPIKFFCESLDDLKDDSNDIDIEWEPDSSLKEVRS